MRTAPVLAARDCGHCQAFVYDEEAQCAARDAEGNLVPRHPKNPPPCRKPTGCPKGTPEQPRTLTAKNWRAYMHYLECVSCGHFPDDSIVRRNAALIAMAEREAQAQQQWLLREATRATTQLLLASLRARAGG